MSSSSEMEPFTSAENKIDTTNEMVGKGKVALRKVKEEKHPSAALSYKERLRERLAKEKAKLAKLSKESLMSERRMFSLEDDEDQRHGSAYKARVPRERRFRSRFDQVLSYQDELLLNVKFTL